MSNGKLLNPNAQPEIPLPLPLFSDRIEGTDSLGLPQSIRKTGPGQFAPRFGLAYKVGGSDRMVVRAAYGLFPIYLDSNLSLQWVKVPPFEIAQTVNNATGKPSFNWANPFNGQSLLAANTTGLPCPGTTVIYATCTAPNVFSAPTTLQHTYMHQYSLALQAESQKNLSMEVAYVGNKPFTGNSSPYRTMFPFLRLARYRRAAPIRSGVSSLSALPTERPTITRSK